MSAAPTPASAKKTSPAVMALGAGGVIVFLLMGVSWFQSRGMIAGPQFAAPSTSAPAPASGRSTVTVQVPPVDRATELQIQALASGPGIDAALRAAALWIDDRAIWFAVLMLAIGGVIWATHIGRTVGRGIAISAAIGGGILWLLPVVIVTVAHLIEFRDTSLAASAAPVPHR